jgi:hypothetical protein
MSGRGVIRRIDAKLEMDTDHTSPEFVLRFIRHHGEINEYPIHEFFGLKAWQTLCDLVANGLVEERPAEAGWPTYTLTKSGAESIAHIPPFEEPSE